MSSSAMVQMGNITWITLDLVNLVCTIPISISNITVSIKIPRISVYEDLSLFRNRDKTPVFCTVAMD